MKVFCYHGKNLPSCFPIEFLEQLQKFLVNFTLLKYVKSQRSYGFLITKELIFGFQILDLKDHFSAYLIVEVLNDQNLFTESNLARWFLSYVQFCSGGHFSERAEAAR